MTSDYPTNISVF